MVQSVMVGMSWRQEYDRAARRPSTIIKGRTTDAHMLVLGSLSSLLQFMTCRLGNGATHLSASHPILINIIKIIPQIITQKAISQMILHFFQPGN